MHGKAQCKPAQHVVLDCKLVPLHNTCQSLPAVCYITSMRKGWQCPPIRKFRGWAKTRQPFSVVSGQSSPNLGHVGESLTPCRLTSFFPIVDMFCCRDMCGQSSKSVPKKRFFCPQPVGGKCPGELGPNFSNSSHKWICCVQVWLRSVQWPQASKKNHSGKI